MKQILLDGELLYLFNMKLCKDKDCKIKEKHYHCCPIVNSKLVNKKGLSYCCGSKVHIEVTCNPDLCYMTCKKCGGSLSGYDVIIMKNDL